MTSLSKKLLLILIPVIILLIGCMGLLLFLPDGSSNVYVEQIKIARRLAENGDYQNAIVYYKNAIAKDDTQEDPYIELAKIYFQINMNDEGIRILREGIAKTNSTVMVQTLEYYEIQIKGLPDKLENQAKVEAVDFNSNYVNIFAAYNYEKYSADCTVKKETTVSDTYTVIYEQYDAIFEYTNSADNTVLDTSTGKPYSYARPTSIKLNNLGQFIAGVEDGISLDKFKECGASNVSVQSFDKALNTYLLTFEYNGMNITLGCDKDGTVKGIDSYNKIVPKSGQKTTEKVESTGKIIDVTTGKSVDNVTIKFHAGKDNKNGEVAATETANSGTYSVELEPGDYTVEITADGYNTEYFDLYVSDTDNDKEQVFSISPVLASNEIRFVLEWGAMPYDLDSYLDGRCTSGGNTDVSVSYVNRTAKQGSEIIADLDIDDVDGFGPETITLYNTNGTYEYKVHRFSSVGDLASSGATVKIYTSNSANPIVITVPDDVDDEWWTVCTVENGEIKNINGRQS